MKKRLNMAAAMFVAAIALPSLAFAQPVLFPSSSLAGDDPDGTLSVFGDAYGAGADAWKDWLFVGTPRETTFRDGFDQQDGAVYAYRNVGGAYIFQQKLTMPGSSGLIGGVAPVGDRFGGGIEAAGGWLFVAAANDQDFPGFVDPREGANDPNDPAFQFAGQVHVYKFNGSTWDFVQTLTAPVPKTGGSFGARSQASHIALNSKGNVAVIGEPNINTPELSGQLHTYRLKEGSWQYVQTIDQPFAELEIFGDDLVFANDKYLVAGGGDDSDDGLSNEGYIFVYQSEGKSGKLFATPKQSIAGPVVAFADCAGGDGFGQNGLDAAGGVVAVADPCATGTAGPLAGTVSVYRLSGGPLPLAFEALIEGDEPNLYFGRNAFGARHAIAVSKSGGRILVGTSGSPGGFLDDGSDVRVYAYDGSTWAAESKLTSATSAVGAFRGLGDTVFFINNRRAFVRENNFLSPIITGLKGQGLLYDLTP